MQTPKELARAGEALARAPAQSPSDAAALAAWEREADAALRAAMTSTAFRLAAGRECGEVRAATQRPGAGGPPTRRDSSARLRHHGVGRRARRARQARVRLEKALRRRFGHVDLAAAPHALPARLSAARLRVPRSSCSSAGASGASERRRCACPGCPNGGRNKCSACKSVEYCSRACQKLHWVAHKAACKVTSPGSKT